MEPTFWQNIWARSGEEPAFHRSDIHPYVKQYLSPEVLKGRRVLVPLCGKSRDLLWFHTYAQHVSGIELVEKPILQFLAENQLSYTKTAEGRFDAENITLLNADIFAVDVQMLGQIDLVYDRAALIALPLDIRLRYVQHIDALLPVGAQIFLNTIEYAPARTRPPFSISPEDVLRYYGSAYSIEQMTPSLSSEDGMARSLELPPLQEHAFFLTKLKNLPAGR